MRKPLTEQDRYAEMAVLVAMLNLPAWGKPLNCETVPDDAARRLAESSPPKVSLEVIRGQIEAAIVRLQNEGLIYAPDNRQIPWRHLNPSDINN